MIDKLGRYEILAEIGRGGFVIVNHVADYSRLSEEVDEEVRTLQDHLEALEEVKLGLN